jgi:CelD/BcsL family acetyltransferase involved in cellulose biosynthesis
VSQGYEAYARDRTASSNVLKQAASSQRRLARDHRDVEVVWDSADPHDLELLVRWKEQQYRRTGVRDVFADPWVLDVLRELRAMDHPDCRAPLAVLRAGGRVVALHLGLARAGVLASWFPVYDPDFHAFSPGNVLMHAMAQMAPEHGIESIDLGRGTQQYKERFANTSYEVADGRVPARGGAFRAAVLVRHPGWLGLRLHRAGRS